MIITPAFIAAVTGRPINDNMRSTCRALAMRPGDLGAPHRLAHFLGQAATESGCWVYDREIWGPTAAQARYDTRTDLGNTAGRDGDGYLFRGRGGFQLTGRANYAAFGAWAAQNYPGAPDFVAQPDKLNTDPWEGLSALWFWEANRISAAADTGSVEAVTRIINGGTNGLADRIKWTGAFGAALAGCRGIRDFQDAHALTPDGVVGPITSGVLHKVLKACPPIIFALS